MNKLNFCRICKVAHERRQYYKYRKYDGCVVTMHEITMNEIRDYWFWKGQGEIYRRVWGYETKGEMI